MHRRRWNGKCYEGVHEICGMFFKYEGWNFNSGNYLFTTDTK